MKFRMIYLYSTTNTHVYEVTSTDPAKAGLKVWLPRHNHPNSPLMETGVMISERAATSKERKYAQLKFKMEEP